LQAQRAGAVLFRAGIGTGNLGRPALPSGSRESGYNPRTSSHGHSGAELIRRSLSEPTKTATVMLGAGWDQMARDEGIFFLGRMRHQCCQSTHSLHGVVFAIFARDPLRQAPRRVRGRRAATVATRLDQVLPPHFRHPNSPLVTSH
jgi:hypothetical protein